MLFFVDGGEEDESEWWVDGDATGFEITNVILAIQSRVFDHHIPSNLCRYIMQFDVPFLNQEVWRYDFSGAFCQSSPNGWAPAPKPFNQSFTL